MMSVSINGTDITDYIGYNGLKWTRYDIDAPKAGRTLDGLMHRGRVATKIKMEITCRPLTTEELNELLNLILPEYITVTYVDPMYGATSKVMYANNNPAQYHLHQRNGREYWTGVSFPLVER